MKTTVLLSIFTAALTTAEAQNNPDQLWPNAASWASSWTQTSSTLDYPTQSDLWSSSTTTIPVTASTMTMTASWSSATGASAMPSQFTGAAGGVVVEGTKVGLLAGLGLLLVL